VRSFFLQRTHGFDGSVFADVEMVTGTAKTSCPVGSVHIPLREGFIFTGSGTMDYYQIDYSHLFFMPAFIAGLCNFALHTEFSVTGLAEHSG